MSAASLKRIFAAAVIVFSALSSASARAEPAAPQPASLEGREWGIKSYSRGREHVWVYYFEERPFIRLVNGKVEGSLGCGKLAGGYVLQGQVLQLDLRLDETSRCGREDRVQAKAIADAIQGQNIVKGIPSEYVAFELVDQRDRSSARLDYKERGADFSELKDTFWKVISIEGQPDFESGVLHFDRGDFALSISRSGKADVEARFPFRYGPSGIKLSRAWSVSGESLDGLARPLAAEIASNKDKLITYTRKGTELIIHDQSGATLLTATQLNPVGIEHQRWRVYAFRQDGRWRRSPGDYYASLMFYAGRVGGETGVKGDLDHWQGSYQTEGGQFSANANGGALTGIWRWEDLERSVAISSALGKARSARNMGDRYRLISADGVALIELAPWPSREGLTVDRTGRSSNACPRFHEQTASQSELPPHAISCSDETLFVSSLR